MKYYTQIFKTLYIITFFSLTGLYISLLGCGVKLIPVATPGAEIDKPTDTISQEKEGVRVTVRAEEPRYIPSWTEGYLTTFLVSICNGTSKEISVDPASFLLFDEERNQYNAIAPQDITRHRGRYRPFPFWGLSYWYGFPHHYYFHTSFPLYYYDGYSEQMFWSSLPRAEIKAGAKVSGLVYFRAKPETHERVRLVAVAREPGEDVELSFEFTFSLER